MRFQVVSNVHGNRQEIERFAHAPTAKDVAIRYAENTPFGVAFEVIDLVNGTRLGHARRPHQGESAVWQDAA